MLNALFIWNDGRHQVIRIDAARPFYRLPLPFKMDMAVFEDLFDGQFLVSCGIKPPLPEVQPMPIAEFEFAGEYNGAPVYRQR